MYNQTKPVKNEPCSFPTEILLLIFKNLGAKELIKNRQVSKRWRYIIDSFHESETLWHDYCIMDYKGVYKTAKAKAEADLSWYNIYKSLSLWPHLSISNETIGEFSPTLNFSKDNYINFMILERSVIGVHQIDCIIYFNLKTLKPARRPQLKGNYLRYKENDNALVILGFHTEMYIIRTKMYTKRYQRNVIIQNVKLFLIVEQLLYYVTCSEEIYLVNLDNEMFDPVYLCKSTENILCLGHSNGCLYFLTFQKKMYCLNNKRLLFAYALTRGTNLISLCNKYNFLEDMDWRVFYNWMYIFNHGVPTGPLGNIMVVRIYGDMVFVGCNWGVLQIYYLPYTNGELDLFNSQPIKQYNFMEYSDCPVLSDYCPVIQVDVIETEDGHKLIAAMPNKIVLITFKHNFNMTESVAVI